MRPAAHEVIRPEPNWNAAIVNQANLAELLKQRGFGQTVPYDSKDYPETGSYTPVTPSRGRWELIRTAPGLTSVTIGKTLGETKCTYFDDSDNTKKPEDAKSETGRRAIERIIGTGELPPHTLLEHDNALHVAHFLSPLPPKRYNHYTGTETVGGAKVHHLEFKGPLESEPQEYSIADYGHGGQCSTTVMATSRVTHAELSRDTEGDRLKLTIMEPIIEDYAGVTGSTPVEARFARNKNHWEYAGTAPSAYRQHLADELFPITGGQEIATLPESERPDKGSLSPAEPDRAIHPERGLSHAEPGGKKPQGGSKLREWLRRRLGR